MAETPEQPNIVVFLCDQLRPDFLCLYGNQGIPTPNLDRLGQRGVVFERAITQSTVCAPARATMMTGRYVSDHGVWTNDVPFREGLDYLPERMNALGYATAAFGKLHHYPAPDGKGFQTYVPMEENRLGADEPYVQWLKRSHPQVTSCFNHTDHTFDFSEAEYYEHWIATHAIEFLGQHLDRSPSQPFFAWISFQGPHGPYDPPAEVKGSCAPDALPRPIGRPNDGFEASVHAVRSIVFPAPDNEAEAMRCRVAYAETIVEIDRQIGRVLASLEELRVLEHTVILFSADHGDLLGDHANNQKGPFSYRGQLEVPLVLANHPAIEPGSRSRALVGTIDIPGTVLDIAGDDEPIGVSRSLVDAAQPSPAHRREVNFSEFCDSVKTVEDERYRFSYYPFIGEAELYDLQADRDELNNLANDPAYLAVRLRMTEHLLELAIIAKGVRIEAHDFVTPQQAGLKKKHPHFVRDFPISAPLSQRDVQRLKQAGLDGSINALCQRPPTVAAPARSPENTRDGRTMRPGSADDA